VKYLTKIVYWSIKGSSENNGKKPGISSHLGYFIMRMAWKRALERWETRLTNCEATPQAVWPISKSLTKRGWLKVPSTIHGPLGLIFYPIDEANVIADCLRDQFRARDLCDCDCRCHVEAEVEALLGTIDEDTPVNFWLFDVSKEMQFLKLGKPNRSHSSRCKMCIIHDRC
jgi:hypothetical protein